MMKSIKNKNMKNLPPNLLLFDKSDLPVEKFGTETEVEKQIKIFLDKQLETKINLKEQFAQHRTFANSSTFTPLTQLIHGECSLEKFKEIENAEEKRQELQRSGLSQDEIELFTDGLNSKSKKDKGLLTNPEVMKQRIEKIHEKLATHKKELENPETFKNIKILNRHEMEIEKTLYAGCDIKKHVNTLIAEREIAPLSENDPFKIIKNLSDKLSQACHRKQRRKRNKLQEKSTDSTDISGNTDELKYDPSIHHVLVPLEDQEVMKKKLHLDEIKGISRFANYEPGIPNKVLFLKNLHPKVDISELQVIFSRFEFENLAPINYRILTGKMRGQAFLEFTNVETAKKALAFANGYMLKEKPLIVQFGRQRSASQNQSSL